MFWFPRVEARIEHVATQTRHCELACWGRRARSGSVRSPTSSQMFGRRFAPANANTRAGLRGYMGTTDRCPGNDHKFREQSGFMLRFSQMSIVDGLTNCRAIGYRTSERGSSREGAGTRFRGSEGVHATARTLLICVSDGRRQGTHSSAL